MFTRAVVRPPGSNFAQGLTTANLGRPIYAQALLQHEMYCQALERCGIALTRLDPDLRFPDATFVEDVAILTPQSAILTRPGAPSRAGEVASMAAALGRFYPAIQAISEPGTLDGGDICEAGDRFFIGLSERTNEVGANQLAQMLAKEGCSSTFVDVRNTPGILHLKSGIAYLGEGRLVVIDVLSSLDAWHGYEIVAVPPGEEYAANCVRVNDSVILAAGFPSFEASIRRLGLPVVTLEMSEFQCMDGGLSCLSLRF